MCCQTLGKAFSQGVLGADRKWFLLPLSFPAECFLELPSTHPASREAVMK